MQDRVPQGPPYRDDDDGDGDEGGFDVAAIRDYLNYAVRAVRLHRLAAAAVTVTIATLACGIVVSLPKTYHVESKLFAQKEAGVENRRSSGADPLKGVAEIIKGHDNLAALVKQLDLVTWSRDKRAPAQRLKAYITGFVGRVPTDEDIAKGLVGVLELGMNVWQTDATATITLDWSDGVMAARIIDTAEQNFLEKRHVMEISTIAESVSILEEHAEKLRSEIEELARQGRPAGLDAAPGKPLLPGGGGPATAPLAASPSAAAAAVAIHRTARKRPEVDADLIRQKVMIETKQRAISDLEQFRQRRLLDLQASLAEQRSKYTDAHPIVVGLRENIEATSRESPQVTSLRAEVKSLQDAYDKAMRQDDAPTTGSGGMPVLAAAPASPAAATPGVNDLAGLLLMNKRDSLDPAMDAQIQYAVAKYAEVRGQVSTARIDLDLAQAAFRYRYSVVVPPEPPLSAIKPKVSLLCGAAVLLALLLGILTAVAAEIRSGRIVGRWQVERLLKLPVLAELPYRTAPKPEDRS